MKLGIGKLTGSGDDDTLLALVSLTGMAEAGALREINARKQLSNTSSGSTLEVPTSSSSPTAAPSSCATLHELGR